MKKKTKNRTRYSYSIDQIYDAWPAPKDRIELIPINWAKDAGFATKKEAHAAAVELIEEIIDRFRNALANKPKVLKIPECD